MELKEGMSIKMFDNTNRTSYMKLINDEGFECKEYRDRLVVGRRIKPKYDKKKLGDILLRARCKKQIKRNDMAERVWVSSAVLRMWEIGKNMPSDEDLKRYCNIVGLNMEKVKSECMI